MMPRDGCCLDCGTKRQHAGPGAVCQLDRHHDRVFRLLHLRERGGAGFSAAVFPRIGSRLGDAAVVRDVRDRLLRAAHRVPALRPLRRSHGPLTGSSTFGGIANRIGSRTTLVAALLTLGLSTMTIGVLPTYASIGIVDR